METTHFVEPDELGWAMSTDAMSYESKMTFTEVKGGTRVQQSTTVNVPSRLRGALWFLLANVMMRRQLRRLRGVLED